MQNQEFFTTKLIEARKIVAKIEVQIGINFAQGQRGSLFVSDGRSIAYSVLTEFGYNIKTILAAFNMKPNNRKMAREWENRHETGMKHYVHYRMMYNCVKLHKTNNFVN